MPALRAAALLETCPDTPSALQRSANRRPDSSPAGTTFARFRLSKLIGLSYTGVCTGGEVEDYTVRILPKRSVVSVSVVTTNCVLAWSAFPGALYYEVYCTTDLTQPFPSGWTNLTPAGITATSWQENIAAGCRFYRVAIVLP